MDADPTTIADRSPTVVDHDLHQHGHTSLMEECLAFVNTSHVARGRVVDDLDTPKAAVSWFSERSLVHPDARDRLLAAYAADPSLGTADLALVRRVRDSLRGLFEAAVTRRPPTSADLRTVNRTLRTPYAYVLVPAADGISLGHRHVGDPVDGALARIAEGVARELSQGAPERLRICESAECREVFMDRSRTGRRRWCDMSTCGNRAKAARHRARRRAFEDEAGLALAHTPITASIEPSA
jgi:predicted RNA-binding Zn ribbon-like protein